MQESTHISGPHVAWVDVARVLAAVSIIGVHVNFYLPDGYQPGDATIYSWVWGMFLAARTPFFLLMAGFFVGSGSFGSIGVGSDRWVIVRRTWFLLRPYLFWITVSIFAIGWSTASPNYEQYAGLYNYESATWWCSWAFWQDLLHAYGVGGHPLDAPMWFLRDIIICTFFAPALARLGGFVLPVAVVLLGLNLYVHGGGSHTYPSIDSAGFFMLGLVAARYPLDFWSKLLDKYACFFAIATWALTPWLVYARALHSVLLVLIGIAGLASTAFLLAKYFPRVGSSLARLAPAGFFVFGAHLIPIVLLQESGVISVKGSAWNYIWLALIPCIYIFLIGVFFAVKRLCPCILPYIAAYRAKT